MIKIIRIPKAEQWAGDHFHECNVCDAHSEPQECMELARDCEPNLECYRCTEEMATLANNCRPNTIHITTH